MSRAAVSKSQAGKAGKGQSSSAPAASIEIIPGKFNSHDWNLMVEKDDGDEFVTDIVEEVCQSALDIIYANYIQRQLIPYTVVQAKDAILAVIEHQFLSRDDGEAQLEEDFTWIEDEEPIPAIADCWAQGIVPKQIMRPITQQIEETEEEQEQEEEEETSIPIEETSPEEEIKAEETVDDEKPEEMEEEDDAISEIMPREPAQPQGKRRYKFVPHRGPMKSPGLNKGLLESLDQTEMKMLQMAIMEEEPSEDSLANILNALPSSCQSLLKVQAGRPPGNRDVTYDDLGNVVAIVKFDPSRLPSHFVKTKFTLVDPAVEAAQARLEAMRTGRYIAGTSNKKTVNTSSLASQSLEEKNVRTSFEKTVSDKKKDAVTPLPPPLTDSMEVAAGVTVREGNRIKHGPRVRTRKTESALSNSLRPIITSPNIPSLTAADLFQDEPVLRFIQDVPPIPPISKSNITAQ